MTAGPIWHDVAAADYLLLLPVLLPASGAVLVLLLDVLRPTVRRLVWAIATLVLGAAVVAAIGTWRDGDPEAALMCLSATRCLYQVDRPGAVLQLAILLAALVVTLLAAPVPTARERSALTTALLLASTAGAVGVVAARDLASWLVLLELATLPTIALVAFRSRRSALDGALNLLATALISFAVLAMGAATWFAATGSALLDADAVLAAASDPVQRRVLVLSVMLLLAGLGFKLSLVPFHAWTPEAYAGASSPIAAFLAVVSKLAALGALLVVLRAATALGSGILLPIGVLAGASMTIGNVMALRERSVLRFLAWSTVAQSGWVVLPLATVATGAVTAATGYLVLICAATLVAFTAVTLSAHADGREQVRRVSQLRGLVHRRPVTTLALAMALLMLAGLPPAVGGVVAKVAVLRPVVSADLWWLAVLAALNAMLGVAVYLRVLRMLFGADHGAGPGAGQLSTAEPAARLHAALLGVGIAGLVLLSVAPQVVLDPLTR